jgi:sarcosine oxidase subunit beta
MVAKKRGGEFRFNSKVKAILKGDNKIIGVALEKGDEVFSPIVINAAGPHSFQINALAEVELPLSTKPLRHEVAYVEAPSPNKEKPVLIDVDNFIYLRPDGADLMIGTLDPDCDPQDIVDPDDYNTSLTEQWTNQAWRAGLRFESLGIPNTARGTVALYDVSDDWIPIYDKTDLEGYFLAIGTSGNQFKNAPMIGDLMATIILGVQGGHDHDKNPLTLDLKTVGKTISLGHYSRLREVKDTSNVMA